MTKSLSYYIADKKPWTTGLYETIIAVDWILKQNLQQRNRVALILLDSSLEIAFKEYLVNESGTPYSDARLQSMFADRNQVHNEVRKYVKINETILKKINHYYQMRCQLIHRRASVGVSDLEVEDFRGIVQSVLSRLFKLKFAK